MSSDIWFPVAGLFFSVMTIIVFYSKGSINTRETHVYKYLIVTNFFGLLLEIMCTYASYIHNDNLLLSDFILKAYLVYNVVWVSILTYYTFAISHSELIDKRYKTFVNPVFVFLTFLASVIIYILPIDLVVLNDFSVRYTKGPSVAFTYVVCGILILYMFFCIIMDLKHLKNKRFIPIFAFLSVGLFGIVIQVLQPGILILTFIETFVTIIMFHTIENPDVKLINQLEVAREQADKANRAKTDFLSSMSHEIRTPLNAIVGFSDCIMDSTTLGEAKENATDIINASQTLLEIVNGILDISKIEAGKIEIVNSRYNAPLVFEELAKLITPKMQEKGLDFSYKIAPDLPKALFGDHANIKKIVTNLLSNACKYTEKGFVHYEVNCINTKDVSKLIISVEDSGRGIKKDSIDKLFTKFQRLDEDRNTTIEGTGLGLAITKQLIELMGGKIIVHTVYGEGSKFTVVLNQKIEYGEVENTKRVKNTLDLTDIRILLVDDTPLNIKVTCKLLEKYNANHIVTCINGFECIEKIQRGETYDLILLDDMMPKMSGVETLQKLKEMPGFHTPTVALTANAITGMREKYIKEGFDDYLAKPIEKDQLIQVVNQILGRSITEDIEINHESIQNEVPSIRGEVIPNVEEYEAAEEERAKRQVIPVEDNIEVILGDQLDRNYHEEEIELKETPLEIQHIEEIPEEETPYHEDNNEVEVSYDRKYLEEHGVDINTALELLGDMNMYNVTLQDFYRDIFEKWRKIEGYKEENNMSEYSVLVHSLKSDCKYLGFMKLADISYQHELKSKDNDIEYVKDHFHELEDEYHKVIDIVKEYVEHNPMN